MKKSNLTSLDKNVHHQKANDWPLGHKKYPLLATGMNIETVQMAGIVTHFTFERDKSTALLRLFETGWKLASSSLCKLHDDMPLMRRRMHFLQRTVNNC